jgi:hypothetical protein
VILVVDPPCFVEVEQVGLDVLDGGEPPKGLRMLSQR